MLKENKNWLPYVVIVGLIILLLLWLAARTFAQKSAAVPGPVANPAPQETKKQSTPVPVFSDYKGIKIGTPVEAVRSILKIKPKFEDKDGLYYILSNTESAQFAFDENKKVKLISVTYSGNDSKGPTYEDVFSKNVPIKTMPDGRVHNLISYAKRGFWVEYDNSMGNNPTIVITISKLLKAR